MPGKAMGGGGHAPPSLHTSCSDGVRFRKLLVADGESKSKPARRSEAVRWSGSARTMTGNALPLLLPLRRPAPAQRGPTICATKEGSQSHMREGSPAGETIAAGTASHTQVLVLAAGRAALGGWKAS